MTEAWFDEAQQRFQAHDWEGAQSLLEQAVKNAPDGPVPRYHLANLHRFLKQPSQAVETLEPLENAPNTPAEYLWALFESRIEAGAYQTAANSVPALPFDEDASPERLELALDCARLSGDYSFALQIANRTGDKKAASDMRWVLRVKRLLWFLPRYLRMKLPRNFSLHALQRWRWRRARIWLEAARMLHPGQFEWPFRLAHLQRISRDPFDPQFQWEFAWLSIALALQPDRNEAKRMRALTLFDMEPGQNAVNEIEDNPDAFEDAERLRLLAACHANLHRYDKAEALYRQLFQTDDASFAQFCLGLIKLEQGDYSTALKYFEQAEEDCESEDGFQFALWFFYQASMLLENGCGLNEINGQTIIEELDGRNEAANAFEEIEEFCCSLCGDTGGAEPLWKDRSTGWQRARCGACGMISVTPMPTEAQIKAIYTRSNRGDDSVNRGYRRQLMEALKAPDDQLKTLNAYREAVVWDGQFDWDQYELSLGADKRCLDVGCASGRTVATFQRLGWNAQGIDVDPQAIHVAEEHGLNVSLATFDGLDAPRASFDLITFVDVIEHVREPKALMKRACELLKPGGVAYLKTPCADSLPHRLVGERWLESAEHIQFFNLRTLTALATQCGFEIVTSTCQVDEATPLLHYEQWQGQRLPNLFRQWVDKFQAGDAVRLLVRKPCYL